MVMFNPGKKRRRWMSRALRGTTCCLVLSRSSRSLVGGPRVRGPPFVDVTPLAACGLFVLVLTAMTCCSAGLWNGIVVVLCAAVAASTATSTPKMMLLLVVLPLACLGIRCVFEGHRKLYGTGSRALGQLCLGYGCSTWFKQKLRGLREPPPCACGLPEPSRPHLLWGCAHFDHCVQAVGQPQDRLQAKAVPEIPPAPDVIDNEQVVDELVDLLSQAFAAAGQGNALVGTDGSSIDGVAAASIASRSRKVVAFSTDGEDQSSYKAEVAALVFLCRALLRFRDKWKGRLVVACDCKAAIDAFFGRGTLFTLVQELTAARTMLSSWGLLVDLVWIPSHGKALPRAWRGDPQVPVDHLRIVNEFADDAARAWAVRRACGSLRQRWTAASRAAAQ